MTFRQLALSNLRGSWLRYAAFFLSSTFSVMLFFMYAQFLFHPDLQEGVLYGGDSTRVVLFVCLVLVAVFAFFFVSYSSGAFLRARSHEFGMLTLLGTTRRQLRRLVWLENTFLSVLATIAGIALGLLFNRLFFLGLSRVLQVAEPLPVKLVPQSIVLTLFGFLLLFQAVILISSFRIGRRSVLELLQDARTPRTVPRANLFLAFAGLVLVFGGYITALVAPPEMIVLVFVPVVVVVVSGTYLVFSQGAIWVMNSLRRLPMYMRGTTMLTVSQLVFRLRDNSRLLATITNLSAVVLAAAGTFYIISQQVFRNAGEAYPTALTVHEGAALPPETVLGILQDRGAVDVLHGSVTVVLHGDYLISQSQADELLQTPGVAVAYGEPGLVELSEGVAVQATALEVHLSMVPAAGIDWFVLPDDEWLALSDESFTVDYYDWRDTGLNRLISTDLEQLLGGERMFRYTAERYSAYQLVAQTLALSMFAGLFVSLLFFIGSGSLIYFKLFTELPDDARLFGRLRRVGVTVGETRRIVTGQIALVFLLPFAAGSVHALIALDALGTMLMSDVTRYSLLVVALFALVQLGFFLLTRWTYLRALIPNGAMRTG